jgi:hypothetical protein
MLTVDKCDILWTVVKSQQSVTMKVCIEPQPLIIASNISDLNISSLQNYSYTLPNTTSLNIPVNTSNTSMPFNISNTSLNTYTSSPINNTLNASSPINNTLNASSPINNTLNASSPINNTLNASSPIEKPLVAPSPSVIDDILVVLPTDDVSVAPSSKFIRGSPAIDTPSPQANLTSLSPSSVVDNITGYILVISFCLILIIIAVCSFGFRRHRNKLKIPFNKGKLKNTKDRKYIKGKIYTSTVTPNHLIEKPKDFAIEYLNNNEQKTNRQVPHPPSKEVSEDDAPSKEVSEGHDINDTPPSE